MDAAANAWPFNIIIPSMSIQRAQLLLGCKSRTDVRKRLEIDLRSELGDPDLQIIHIGSENIHVSCLTVSPRNVLQQCAEKKMCA